VHLQEERRADPGPGSALIQLCILILRVVQQHHIKMELAVAKTVLILYLCLVTCSRSRWCCHGVPQAVRGEIVFHGHRILRLALRSSLTPTIQIEHRDGEKNLMQWAQPWELPRKVEILVLNVLDSVLILPPSGGSSLYKRSSVPREQQNQK
jgi:hypothetical protein